VLGEVEWTHAASGTVSQTRAKTTKAISGDGNPARRPPGLRPGDRSTEGHESLSEESLRLPVQRTLEVVLTRNHRFRGFS
jgi:hypothetical protein